MARPSKTQQFENVDNIPTEIATERWRLTRNDSACEHHDHKGEHTRSDSTALDEDAEDEEELDEDGQDEEDDEEHDHTCLVRATLKDANIERRQSAVTSTSISSFPESTFETDYEAGIMHKPYTPPVIRPSFRRPESVRKMQMSSPTPSERNLRRSILLHPRARTPRSNRSSVKGSPKPKKLQERELAEEHQDYSLVLLHVSLLPVELRWSLQSLQEILPAHVLETLQLLKSKVSETVADRGILIPHPREEYELLEDRLLEALELKKERVTKCGHFRARHSTSSTSSLDSGIATSVESLDEEVCETCQHHIRPSEGVISTGRRKWSIKVFAANGLMRAPAWTAAWSEMERVDVEILPWIGEDLRKKLDAKALMEEAELRAKHEEEDARIKEMAEQQIRLAREERRMMRDVRKIHHAEPETPPTPREKDQTAPATEKSPSRKEEWDELPQVYRPKDIPLALLLKNYLYLLAQDRRNVTILALILLILFLRLGVASGPNGVDLPPISPQQQDLRAEAMHFPTAKILPSSLERQTPAMDLRSDVATSATEHFVEVAFVTPAAAAGESTLPVVAASASTSVVRSRSHRDLCLNEAFTGYLFGTLF